MKVYCLFLLESPQRGDSNEYTQYIISQYTKENHPKLFPICNYGICSKGPKNEFEPAVVNEPSVFEPSKFYYIYIGILGQIGPNNRADPNQTIPKEQYGQGLHGLSFPLNLSDV